MKNRVISVIKTVCILALAALAVFQVSQLWLGITNGHFMLYLQARFPPAAPDGQSEWARPFRVIYGGGGRFNIRYISLDNAEDWAYGAEAFEAVLRSAAFVQETEFSRVLERDVLIYDYNFNMCAETFARALGLRNGAALTNQGITCFNRVAVWPPSEEDAFLRAFFISDDTVFEFALPPGGRRHPSEDFEKDIPRIGPLVKHFVPVEGGFALRAPQGFMYNPLIVENPYLDSRGLLSLDSIRSRIEPFFDNPATIIFGPSVDDVYTFNNLNTMVRYMPGDVLEYTSFRTIGRMAPADLMSDFSAALAFVRGDVYAHSEIFFAGYDDRGRENVFWFGYIAGDFPVVMLEEWHSRPDCNDPLWPWPIEVVVDNGRVVRYRRLVYNFRQSEEFVWFDPAALEMEGHLAVGFPLGHGPEIRLMVIWG